MTLGTPDSPRSVTSENRARRYFTRTAGLVILAPAILASGIALAGAAEPAAPNTPNTPNVETTSPAPEQEPTCPTDGSDITDVHYVVDGTTYPTLVGNAHAGATVKVIFTIADGCEDDQFSLAAYKAASGTYVPEEASQQVLFDSDSDSFGAGEQSLTVTVPSCFYQVDFVRGSVIEHLTTDAYANAGRLIDHDNGGTNACTTPTETPTETPTPTPTDTPTVLGTTVTKDPVTVEAASSSLPFTGGATPLLLAIGSGLVGAGIAFRIVAARRVARKH